MRLRRLANVRIPGASPLGHIGYWAAVIAVAAMGWALFMATTATRVANERVDRTLELLESIASAKGEVARAESAQRGYLLFAAPGLRKERDEALDALGRGLDRMRELLGPDPSGLRRLLALRELVRQRTRVMTETEALVGRFDELAESSQRAFAVSAEVYALIEQMRDVELRALATRRAETGLAQDRAMLVLVIAVMGVLTVMIPGYVGFVTEAGRRYRAEHLITSLADTVPGALVKYRLLPDGRSRYEFVSSGVEKLRGIKREAALADPEVVLGQILPGDRERFVAALREGARTQTAVQHDYRVRLPDGAIRWMRTSAAPQPSRDGSVVFSAYWTDVTQQRAFETELRESRDAADTANRAKSTFLATMSHEIRTPMNGVLGMLELLSLTNLNAEQRATLEVVRQSGRSLQRIIDDILDFSKIEAGKLELRPEPSSIGQIVERVRNVYAGNASSKGLLLRHQVDPRLPAAVLVDPLRLQQVLGNLVSNAIKFTSDGEVHIRADLAERRDGEDVVAFTVADSGLGISQEDQARLFTPFAQAMASHHAGGTGLGLSICQRLVQMMGGTIVLASAPGRGTSVRVNLPLPVVVTQMPGTTRGPDSAADTVGDRRKAPTPDHAAREGTLLLLVDDHPINRMVLAKQVHALGYAAETAEHGALALERWHEGRFGAVITDCNMPEMNGYELARAIRAAEDAHGFSRTPIIACTANVLGGEADNCRAAGMDDYLAKPIQLHRLAECLDHWVPLPRAAEAAGEMHEAPDDLTSAMPVDFAVLGEVASGDKDAQRELLGKFREFNAEDVVHLSAAALNWDLKQLQHCAHRIKGAARTIGAMPLAAACERLEGASQQRDLPAARDALPAVQDELARLEEFLATHVPALVLPEQVAA